MEKNYWSVPTLDATSAGIVAQHKYKIFIARVEPEPVISNEDCADIMESLIMP